MSEITSEFLKDRSRLHRKANEALDQNLGADEQVEVIITGPSAQAVIGTDRRVFVYKKGFMAGATFGAEMTSWDYRNLVGIQIHTGMMNGAVIVQAPGQEGASTSFWKQSDRDPYKAPNAIPITRPWEQANAGVARLREMIVASHAPQPAAANGAVSSGSVADELHKLATLRDSGVLSAAEFETLKGRLLAGN
jgi:Short C-terminal domain